MRIGLVTTTSPSYSETFFRNKIIGLLENNFKVTLFVGYKTLNDFDIPCEVKICNIHSKSKIIYFKNIIWSLLKIIFLHPVRSITFLKLNITHGNTFYISVKNLINNQIFLQYKLDWLHFGFGALAVGREQVAETIGANMGVSFRGFDLYISPLKHPNCYNKLFKTNAQYHVLSNEMRLDLVKYGVNKRQISVIPPAIDLDFFKPKLKASKNNVLQLLTVARLHWKKGLEYTLEALTILNQNGVKFHYTIVGIGEEYERLAFAVHQLGLKQFVTFAGKKSPEVVKEYLQNSDMYLQYSIQEGFCNAVLEAQAMGLLCIVSNAEGLQENVLHGQTGWVVPKRRPALLAKQIMDVHKLNNENKQIITSNARTRIEQNFNLAKQNEAFLKFYNVSLT